jgi:dephospho-CoA kinase
MPYILGLTGGIGSGKSAATGILSQLGITIVDADIVAKEVVAVGSPALESIHAHFGDTILLASGALDRATLRERIFTDPTEKVWLEQLLHPIIRTVITQRLQAASSAYVVLSSPLLFETQQNDLVDSTLVIDCPEALQRQRAGARDDVSTEQIDQIMAVQLAREARNTHADEIIINTGSLVDLQCAITDYHHRLLAKINLPSIN